MPRNNKLKMEIKIATSASVCRTKKLIKETILNEKINILCMQETETNKNLDHNLLTFPGFAIETENNNTLSRVAVYLDNRISYIRRRDLEGLTPTC